MKKTDAMRAITKAYTTLRDCTDMKDLKKLHFTLSDYNAAKYIFNDLNTPGSSTEIIIQAVADFYKNCGFNVTPKGIGYQISTM